MKKNLTRIISLSFLTTLFFWHQASSSKAYDITPLPESSYKSLWQFQMAEEDGDKRPAELGYKYFNSPDANLNPVGTSGEIQLGAEQLYNCDNYSYIQFQNVVSCQYSGQNMRSFKVYLAPGASGDLSISTSQGNGGSIFLVRFEEPPQGSYDRAEILENSAYYRNGGGAKIEEITGKDYVRIVGDGLQSVFNGRVAEDSSGGWLYVRIIPNNANIQLINFNGYANYAKYKAWYDTMTASNSWRADGDPGKTNPSPTPSPSPVFLPGDLNQDKKVDIFDYNLFLTEFGKVASGNIADLDQNGKVDIFDYNLLLGNFGKSSG